MLLIFNTLLYVIKRMLLSCMFLVLHITAFYYTEVCIAYTWAAKMFSEPYLPPLCKITISSPSCHKFYFQKMLFLCC